MTRMKSNRQPTRIAAASLGAKGGRQLPARAGRALWIAIGWAATFGATAWGMWQLDGVVHAPRPDVACTLKWVGLPDWLKAPYYQAVLAQVERAIALAKTDDPRDPNLCQRVAESMAHSAWVAQVKRVTAQPSGQIRVEAAFREPCAYVEVGRSAYLVDREGVRLPNKVENVADFPDDDPNGPWPEWLRIIGVSAPLPAEGETWGGDDLAAGLKLVQYLHEAAARGEVPFRSALRAVDVGNYELRQDKYDGQLRIRTIYRQGYINWGVPPGEEFEVEAAPSAKLAKLRAACSAAGELPNVILDPRFADEPGKDRQYQSGKPRAR